MAIHICPHCEARNTDAGRCVLCLKNIGSLPKAVAAAFATAAGLALLWILFSMVTRMEALPFAMVFGVVVSGCTTRFSGGHGPLYQLAATLATITGLVV